MRKDPTAPETTATMPPARKALRMKSYSSMAMSVGFEEPVCREHDNAAVDAQHVDGCAVELGEHVAGDDLVDGAQARPAAPEIEHPVHRAKQRIKLVRSEEHCHTIALLDVSNQLDDALLEVRVETDER